MTYHFIQVVQSSRNRLWCSCVAITGFSLLLLHAVHSIIWVFFYVVAREAKTERHGCSVLICDCVPVMRFAMLKIFL